MDQVFHPVLKAAATYALEKKLLIKQPTDTAKFTEVPDRWRRYGFEGGITKLGIKFQVYYLEWQSPTIFRDSGIGPNRDRLCVGFWGDFVDYNGPFQRRLEAMTADWPSMGFTRYKVLANDSPGVIQEGLNPDYPLARVCHFRYNWPPEIESRFAFGYAMTQHLDAYGPVEATWTEWMRRRIDSAAALLATL